ncbi:hypothetical protein KIN20_002121 [Parelaphostrongylus tenuis]|uniref:Uncharacterized protein n=1 Tax=Parelaphostrongylus tenuis TaxID=148309 RepID=A0AAD5MGC2_PARTN|nr:hypothetical protein KIN20_002121 [Parelaphostrongylus tenuis]
MFHSQFAWGPFGLQALFAGLLENVPNRHWITINLVGQYPANHRWIFYISIGDFSAINFS